MCFEIISSVLQYTQCILPICNCRPLHAVGYGTSRHYIGKNTDLDVIMIRKQTSQDICLGGKRATSVYLKAQALNALFWLKQLKPLFGVALDEDFYDEDFNALCTIKIRFQYCENILVLENAVYIFKEIIIISILLNHGVEKKWGGA